MISADQCWLPGQDSNLDAKLQRLLCYRYTTRQPMSIIAVHTEGNERGEAETPRLLLQVRTSYC